MHNHVEVKKKREKNDTAMHLKLGEGSQQCLQCLQVVLIWKDLDYAIHQIILGQLIFTVDNLRTPIWIEV